MRGVLSERPLRCHGYAYAAGAYLNISLSILHPRFRGHEPEGAQCGADEALDKRHSASAGNETKCPRTLRPRLGRIWM